MSRALQSRSIFHNLFKSCFAKGLIDLYVTQCHEPYIRDQFIITCLRAVLHARPHCNMHQARWLYRVAQYTLTSAVDETPCDADSPWPNRRVVTYPQLTARP